MLAKEAEQEAMKAHTDAKENVSIAAAELRNARVARDEAIPKAIIKVSGWRGGNVSESIVCVVRRTAKAAFVRSIGDCDDMLQQYRMNKYGSWMPYPAGSSCRNRKELVFNGVSVTSGAQSTTDA